MMYARRIGDIRISIVDVVMILTLMFLGACAPTATNVLNAAAGDELQMVFVVDAMTPCGETAGDGLCVIPGERPAEHVRVSVLGDPLTTIDDACVIVIENEAECRLGTVDAPTFLRIAGQRVTASIVYRRPGGNRPYQEFAF